jgi:hypothetical protein
MGELRVVLDGVPLPEGESRAFWQRFSAWMEEHVGDLAGFAAAEGLQSVKPELHGGAPVLVASRSAVQVPYTTAVKRSEPGPSGGRPGAKGPPARENGPKRAAAKGTPPRRRGR